MQRKKPEGKVESEVLEPERKFIPWAERAIVYPWDSSAFVSTKEDKANVYDYLRRAKYPIARLMKKPRRSELVNGTNEIMTRLLRREWVLALCDNAGLLQALAMTVPVCFALTTLEPCRNVSTANLIQLFSAKLPEDDWVNDPAGETYVQIAKTGLLVWTGINDMTTGSRIHAGRLVDLLNYRRASRFPTFFTATYLGVFDDTKTRDIMHTIEKVLGTGATLIIKEKAEIINFKFKGKEAEPKTVEL